MFKKVYIWFNLHTVSLHNPHEKRLNHKKTTNRYVNKLNPVKIITFYFTISVIVLIPFSINASFLQRREGLCSQHI